MGDGLLGVRVVFGEDEGRRERGNVDAKLSRASRWAVKASGLGGPVRGTKGPVGGWVGPVVFGFGVEVVRRAGAARAGECGERGRGLREIACGGGEDAVVVDGGDVGVEVVVAGRMVPELILCLGLGQEMRPVWECRNRGLRSVRRLGAEDATSGCHGEAFRRKSITSA